MTLEDRITELEERIKKLENIEKRRRIWGIIKFIGSILLLAATIILGIYLYNKIQTTIKPYQEIVDKYNNFDIKEAIEENTNFDWDNLFG